jgi:hypothetical protein
LREEKDHIDQEKRKPVVGQDAIPESFSEQASEGYSDDDFEDKSGNTESKKRKSKMN